jgi:predicted phage gp36 major capsid-like protein
MVTKSRAERVSAAFVRITDTLIADYDVLGLLHVLVEAAVDLLDAADAGLLLADPHGELQLLASTSERSQLVEILQLQAGSGPCVECYRTGTVVAVGDIAAMTGRWPEFQTGALSQGFSSVHAVPMRVSAIGQALVDVATISIMQERAIRETAMVNEQLQRALNSRVLVEQAKGVIAYTARVSMEEAFGRLRSYARSNNQSLHDTAALVIDRALRL